MSVHPFASAMGGLRRDVDRRATEQRLREKAKAYGDAAREAGEEILAELAANPPKPPKRKLRVIRTDDDREGINGWDPQYDSGA